MGISAPGADCLRAYLSGLMPAQTDFRTMKSSISFSCCGGWAYRAYGSFRKGYRQSLADCNAINVEGECLVMIWGWCWSAVLGGMSDRPQWFD